MSANIKTQQQLAAFNAGIMIDLNKANAFTFYALERECKKEVRDEQMISYLIGIAKLLPVSNHSEIAKYC